MKRAIPPQGSAAEAGSPKSFWSLQIGKNRQSLQKRLGRPVPCEQGAADPNAPCGASTAAPQFVARRFGACVCCSCWRFCKAANCDNAISLSRILKVFASS